MEDSWKHEKFPSEPWQSFNIGCAFPVGIQIKIQIGQILELNSNFNFTCACVCSDTSLEEKWCRFSGKVLADVDISPNPNSFNFWTFESEYVKITGIRIHFFFSKLKESVNPNIWSESIWIHLHFIFCHRIRIQLPLERYGPQPKSRSRLHISRGFPVKLCFCQSWASLLVHKVQTSKVPPVLSYTHNRPPASWWANHRHWDYPQLVCCLDSSLMYRRTLSSTV